MKKWLFSMVAVPVLLMGCSSNDKEVDTNDEPVDVEALEVKVHILTPEEVAVNEPVELAAHVTQNNENVDDAESVKFEVWESGYRDNGQMIDGKLDGDGVYKAEITFDHDGVYYMFAHTTARGLHVMPKQQLIVGNPDMSKVKEDNSSDSMEMDHDTTEEHGETEHSSTEEQHNH
ncbi:FixH family protein [Lysinibacillus endophyticus]|uniref:FixH family protein n=1 Tax=Ureibacillus endophyticus TaxID=1978490 RepID=UPI00209EC8D0|nr:FixH family protein [Lysinibacillus endophyticus]MCP1145852.1 FixH family protein [Lysinibacillus endophyticus]